MSNSNFNITKVKVDPVSQEITELEINGKAVETGGGSNLQEIVFDEANPLHVETIFGERTSPVEIYPSEGYDGIEKVTINSDGLKGYPGEGLEIVYDPVTYSSGISSTITIELPEGEAWTGTITIHPSEP